MCKGMKGYYKVIALKVVLLLLALCAFVYYGIIVSLLGVRIDFSLVWLLFSIFCISLFVYISWQERKGWLGLSRFVYIVWSMAGSLTLIFVIFLGTIIVNGYQKPAKNADYMVVLGAHVRGTKVSLALQYRLDAAYQYAVENKETMIIVSGGKGAGEDITEAEAMFSYLVEKGIPEKRIIKEDKSTSTSENILFSKERMKNPGRVVIVTNHFHVYRGVCIAEKYLPAKVEGLGAKTGTVLFINYYVREVFAVAKDVLVRNI